MLPALITCMDLTVPRVACPTCVQTVNWVNTRIVYAGSQTCPQRARFAFHTFSKPRVLAIMAEGKKSIRFWGTFATLCILSFISGLDVAIVMTALPTITAEIGGAEMYVWIANSFVVASSVPAIMAGLPETDVASATSHIQLRPHLRLRLGCYHRGHGFQWRVRTQPASYIVVGATRTAAEWAGVRACKPGACNAGNHRKRYMDCGG
jgi:hypothetical protein